MNSLNKGGLILFCHCFPETPMSIPNCNFPGAKQGLQISVNTIDTDPDHLHDSFLEKGYEAEEEDDDDDEEELIRVVLRGKYPSGLSALKYELDGKVRKTFSMRTEQDEKQRSWRAFSMRASSASGNEVYRRIDHQYDPVAVGNEATKTDMKRNNKILEACRRFFRF